MVKIFVASFNRASDGALSKLIQKMKDENFYTEDYKEADYILAVGDRKETFDFVLERYRENKKIIHLWAGEISQGTHDEVYRHAMTLMSDIQLCTNNEAKQRVKNLCMSVDKKYFVVTVGNVMLDNMEIDESIVPPRKYDLILYNPPTRLSKGKIKMELNEIDEIKEPEYICIEPNGDNNSNLVAEEFLINDTFPRSQFLGLLKNCNRFITNSSSAYYEAPFLIDEEKIIIIGERNKERESKYGDMSIPNASNNIIKLFRGLYNE